MLNSANEGPEKNSQELLMQSHVLSGGHFVVSLFFVCVLWAHRVCPLLHLPKASWDDPQDEKQPETLHVVTIVPKEASILIKASNQTGLDGLAASSIGLQSKAKCSLAFARQKSAALRCAKSLRHYSRTLVRGQRGIDRQRRIKGALFPQNESSADSQLETVEVGRQNKLQFCWANSFPDCLLCHKLCKKYWYQIIICISCHLSCVQHHGSCPNHLKLHRCWSKINKIRKCPNQIHIVRDVLT